MPNILLIGGRGKIGSGLRTYLPGLDPAYQCTSIDLPDALDNAPTLANQTFIDCDITEHPDQLHDLMSGRDLIVYLARKGSHEAMNRMTDLVFETALVQNPVPMVIGSSSVHAIDGIYTVHEGVLSTLSKRRFHAIKYWPDRIPATIPACPINDYSREKAHVEEWVQKLAEQGHSAIAARWGGINAQNKMTTERGYFALWCHQEDAARFVHACYTAHQNKNLRSGTHYFVVSNNTYNIFDIDIPRDEIGYDPIHNAEVFYT